MHVSIKRSNNVIDDRARDLSLSHAPPIAPSSLAYLLIRVSLRYVLRLRTDAATMGVYVLFMGAAVLKAGRDR